MVIGGQAVLQYGDPRLTRDIDITLGVDTTELANVLQAMRDLGLQLATADVEAFVGKTNVLPMHAEPFVQTFTKLSTQSGLR